MKIQTSCIYHAPKPGGAVEIWLKGSNLLICQRDQAGAMIFDPEKQTHFCADMRRDNLDESEIFDRFNLLAGVPAFEKLSGCVSPAAEKEISLFRDDSGVLHLFLSEYDKTGLNAIVFYSNAKIGGGDDEIFLTYQMYMQEFSGGDEIVTAGEYLEIEAESLAAGQLDFFGAAA